MVYACVPHFNLWWGHKHPCSFQLRIALNLKSTRHYVGIDLVPYVKSRTGAQQNIRGISCRLLIISLYCAKHWWSVPDGSDFIAIILFEKCAYSKTTCGSWNFVLWGKTANFTFFFQWNEFGPSAGLTVGLGSFRVNVTPNTSDVKRRSDANLTEWWRQYYVVYTAGIIPCNNTL